MGPTVQATVEKPGNVPEPRAGWNPRIGLSGNSTRCYAYFATDIEAHQLSAKCKVNNNGQSTSETAWSRLDNTTYVSSAYVYATTSKGTYTAYGEGFRIAGGNLYTGNVSKSY